MDFETFVGHPEAFRRRVVERLGEGPVDFVEQMQFVEEKQEAGEKYAASAKYRSLSVSRCRSSKALVRDVWPRSGFRFSFCQRIPIFRQAMAKVESCSRASSRRVTALCQSPLSFARSAWAYFFRASKDDVVTSFKGGSP